MNKKKSKLFIFLILSINLLGCSIVKDDKQEDIVYGSKDFADAFVSAVKPRWFSTIDRFKLLDVKNEVAPHRFFDINPFSDLRKKTLNAIITTPEDSKYKYELDLNSGQIYLENKFCDQNDEYEKFNSTIDRPPFSVGIIPRILDQLNKPQKVIVFGGKEFFSQYHLTHYFDVRIVGGYIEQICPYGGCLNADEWLSRLVLVAVQNGNEKYSQIKDINGLKAIVDWNYVKAFIQNGFGKNRVASKYYARYRMGAEVEAGQALSFLERNSTVFTINKLKQMRMSCYKLYDYLWKDLSFVSAIEKVATSKDEIRKKAKLVEENRKGKGEKEFYRRFIKNFKKFSDEYKTCSKYVYSTNINDDPKKHWFFAHLTAFMQLHELGYTYNCASNNWEVNPVLNDGKQAKNLQVQFGNCSATDIDKSMDFAVKYLDNLRSKRRKSFRYIDYDKSISGTHAKLYSWVPVSGSTFSCSDKDNMNYDLQFSTFPKDINWINRASSTKSKSSIGDIIY